MQPDNEICAVNRTQPKKNFFFKHQAENEAEKTVPVLFLLFKKALHEGKETGHHLSFNVF